MTATPPPREPSLAPLESIRSTKPKVTGSNPVGRAPGGGPQGRAGIGIAGPSPRVHRFCAIPRELANRMDMGNETIAQPTRTRLPRSPTCRKLGFGASRSVLGLKRDAEQGSSRGNGCWAAIRVQIWFLGSTRVVCLHSDHGVRCRVRASKALRTATWVVVCAGGGTVRNPVEPMTMWLPVRAVRSSFSVASLGSAPGRSATRPGLYLLGHMLGIATDAADEHRSEGLQEWKSDEEEAG